MHLNGAPYMFLTGLGPRTFRNKEVNLGDRSVWTDTPSQRERKKNVRM